MFRTAILRAARTTPRFATACRVSKPYHKQFVRFESNKATEALKAARSLQDDLQRDWDGRKLSYAEVKPKTESPSPVRYYLLASTCAILPLYSGRLLGRRARA
jgi:hypothetical protein